jgi:hypothetical protein
VAITSVISSLLTAGVSVVMLNVWPDWWSHGVRRTAQPPLTST